MEPAKFKAGQNLFSRTYTTSSSETDASLRNGSQSDSQPDTDNSSWTSNDEPEHSDAGEHSDACKASILRQPIDWRPARTAQECPATLHTTFLPEIYLDRSQLGVVATRVDLQVGDGLRRLSALPTIHNDMTRIALSVDRQTVKAVEELLAPGKPRTCSPQEPPDKTGAQDALNIYQMTQGLDLENTQPQRATGLLEIPGSSYAPSETSTVKRKVKQFDDGLCEQGCTTQPDEDEISVQNLEPSVDHEGRQGMQLLPRGTGQGALDRTSNPPRVESFSELNLDLLVGVGTWDADDARVSNNKKIHLAKVEVGLCAASARTKTTPSDYKNQPPESLIFTSAAEIRERKVEDVTPREALGSTHTRLLEQLRCLDLGIDNKHQGAYDKADADTAFVMSNSPIFGTEFETTARTLYNTAGNSRGAYGNYEQEAMEGESQSFGHQSSGANLYPGSSFGELSASPGSSGWNFNPGDDSVVNVAVNSPQDSSLEQSRTLDCPFRKRNPKGNNCMPARGFKDAAKLK